MNILTETKRKLEYQENKLVDLNNCLDKNLTEDGVRFVRSEIEKVSKSVEYFKLVMEVLK